MPGQRLDKFVTKAVPRLPQSLLYKYIRLGRIKIDGKKGKISTRLEQGSMVSFYINDEFFEQPPECHAFLHAPSHVDVLYEDDNISWPIKRPAFWCILAKNRRSIL